MTDLGRAVRFGDRVVAARAALVVHRDRRAEVRQDHRAGRGAASTRPPRTPRPAARHATLRERLALARASCHRRTIDRPVSFSCASISDGTYLSPKPSALAVTRLWCTASPMIDGSIIDSVKCV